MRVRARLVEQVIVEVTMSLEEADAFRRAFSEDPTIVPQFVPNDILRKASEVRRNIAVAIPTLPSKVPVDKAVAGLG